MERSCCEYAHLCRVATEAAQEVRRRRGKLDRRGMQDQVPGSVLTR